MEPQPQITVPALRDIATILSRVVAPEEPGVGSPTEGEWTVREILMWILQRFRDHLSRRDLLANKAQTAARYDRALGADEQQRLLKLLRGLKLTSVHPAPDGWEPDFVMVSGGQAVVIAQNYAALSGVLPKGKEARLVSVHHTPFRYPSKEKLDLCVDLVSDGAGDLPGQLATPAETLFAAWRLKMDSFASIEYWPFLKVRPSIERLLEWTTTWASAPLRGIVLTPQPAEFQADIDEVFRGSAHQVRAVCVPSERVEATKRAYFDETLAETLCFAVSDLVAYLDRPAAFASLVQTDQ